MTNKKSKYILYLDVLRIIAILAVILLHVSNISFFNTQVLKSNSFYSSSVLYCLSRVGVSLFIMISGVTFLNPEKKVSLSYLGKKVLHIFICLVCWLTIYDIFALLCRHERIYFGFVKVILSDLINYKSYYFGNYHLWYLYMIIGLYIVTPIVRLFVKHANKELLMYTFCIWFFFSSCLPLFLKFDCFHFLNIFDAIDIPVITGLVGTYVLGYYLHKIDFKKKWRYTLYGLGILSFFLMTIGTIFLSKRSGRATEVLFDNISCFVIIMSSSIFVLIKTFISNKKFSTKMIFLIKKISGLTFGMYITHEFFIYYTNSYSYGFPLDYTLSNTAVRIVIVTIFVAGSSLLFSYLISKIPLLKKYLL